MDFSNKVIIITGASSGIGAGAAEYISSLGGKLVITGRNKANLENVAAKCNKSGVLPIVADVTVQADRERIIDETIKKFGKIDVLVNNAGIGESLNTPATFDQYDKVMDTNVRSVYYLTQLAAPYLIKTQGNIVNVSSVAGLKAMQGANVYSMSKSALDHFTKLTALDLAPKGVRVNSVNPGVIETGFLTNIGMGDEATKAFLEASKSLNALGRNGTVKEVSKTIAFLACNEVSSFITGTLLAVDGGLAIVGPR